jgi:2-methylaconitate cis-trans-isomerase PrpF
VSVTGSQRRGVDVEYLFAQVGVDVPTVDYAGNCSNLTAAVGPYAIDEGLVEATEPSTRVRLCNRNTGSLIDVQVPVSGGRFDPVSISCSTGQITSVCASRTARRLLAGRAYVRRP